jgi:hypothetical protein
MTISAWIHENWEGLGALLVWAYYFFGPPGYAGQSQNYVRLIEDEHFYGRSDENKIIILLTLLTEKSERIAMQSRATHAASLGILIFMVFRNSVPMF